MQLEPNSGPTTAPVEGTEHQAARREFFKRALTVCAYAAPIVMSFKSQELVRAASVPARKPQNQNDQGQDQQ